MKALNEIRDRLSVITRGPWKVWDRGIGFEVQGQHDEPINSSFRETFSRRDAEFIANAPMDVKNLLAAVEAALELHKPEKRWMPYGGADCSFDTEDEARDAASDVDLGVVAMESIIENGYPYFEVCAHCKTIEDGPCDGECTRENGYRECIWPCPTVNAITEALEAKP